MILYLTSSPCVIHADRPLLTPENDFLWQLHADLPAHPKCVYIASNPDAPERNAHYSRDMVDAFAEAGMTFQELRILQRNTMDQAEQWVDWCDLIILAGGHVPTQNAFFKEMKLNKILSGYHGVIMGISAGTMNCAAIVYAQPEMPGESIDANYKRFLSGLGLTYLNILPHYQQVKDDILDGSRLFEDITFADSFGHSFLVLPDGSYVRVKDGRSVLYGEAYLLEDGKIRQICANNNKLIL